MPIWAVSANPRCMRTFHKGVFMDLRHWATHQLAGFIHREVLYIGADDRAETDWRVAEAYVDDRRLIEPVQHMLRDFGPPSEDTLHAYDVRLGQWFHDSWMYPILSNYNFFERYLPSPPYGARRKDRCRPKAPVQEWYANHLAGIISRTVKGPEQRWNLDNATAWWLIQQEPGSHIVARIVDLVDDERISEQEFLSRYGHLIFAHWQTPLRWIFENAPMRASYGAISFAKNPHPCLSL